MTDIPDSLLCEGDLVFRRGSGIASRFVLSADRGGIYSHIGIVVKDSTGWKVLHAVPGEPDFPGDPDRVKMEPLRDFFHPERAKAGAVMRTVEDAETIKQAIGQAIWFYQAGMLFDHNYKLSDTTKIYCTELVARAFWSAGADLTDDKRSRIYIPGFQGDYILPSDIQNSSRVKLIYNF